MPARPPVHPLPALALAAALVLGAIPATASPATAQAGTRDAPSAAAAPPQEPASRARVRGVDAASAALVREGRARSTTFRRLLEALEESDLIVLVRTAPLTVPGRLQIIGSASGTRFVQITMNVPDTEAQLLGWLAHELQHAVEVARSPKVTSAETLRRFYHDHGQRVAGGWCTAAAQKVTGAVAWDVAGLK